MKLKKILAIALAIITATVAMLVPTTASAVSSSLIDTSKKGSLSIYKYEMEDVSQATSAGTGEATDSSNVPDDAIPFEGVTFKITRVADLLNSAGSLNTTYYTKSGVALPTPEQAASMTAIATYTEVTDSDGFATFTSLPLGIYLVQETASPSHVYQKVKDFVVSIPMTDSTGSAWNYDVKAYPKNETRYADIEIEKTDYATGAVLEGAVFTLQKSENNSTWSTVETGITTDSEGKASPSNSLGCNTYYRFIETKTPNGYILDSNNNTTTIFLDWDGNVCNPTTKQILDASHPSLVRITNTKPSISKNAIDITTNTSTYTDVTVSSTAKFLITFTTPNISDMSTLKTFKIVDKLDKAFTFSAVTATGGTSGMKYSTQYNQNTDNILTITLDTSSLKANSKYTIEILCSVNKTIISDNKLGTAIVNTADIVYSTKTNVGSGDDPTNSEKSNEVEVHTTGFQFKKVDPDNAALAGAQFKLYASKANALAGTNPITAYNASGVSASTFTSDSNGLVSIYGLTYGSAGEKANTTSTTKYYLVETYAPSGYNLLSEPIEITVGKDSWNFTNTQMSVKNSRKTVLPLTGGYGAMTFAIVGVVLFALGGLAFYLAKKRKKSTDTE